LRAVKEDLGEREEGRGRARGVALKGGPITTSDGNAGMYAARNERERKRRGNSERGTGGNPLSKSDPGENHWRRREKERSRE